MQIERVFCSGMERCGNGCGYCFSHWKLPPRFEAMPCPVGKDGWSVVYPACDSEVNHGAAVFWNGLEAFLAQNRKCIASISTKDEWSESDLDMLDGVRARVGARRIKLSVSISCKSMLEVIEPKASRYDTRIALLRRLKERGICHSVMLKPLLPFIGLDEYCEIVDEAGAHCADFVTGDLYVDPSTDFFQRHINGRCEVKSRFCEWMRREIDYVPYQHERELIQHIQSKQLNWYSSDAEFLAVQVKEKNR